MKSFADNTWEYIHLLHPITIMNKCAIFFVTLLFSMRTPAQETSKFVTINADTSGVALTTAGASHFANLVLKCVDKEFPYKTSHTNEDSSRNILPKELHPAFYGCFDWHSCVHGHWMLVRLLRRYPQMPEAQKIKAALDNSFEAWKMEAEANYFTKYPLAKAFERTYGWAWLLKLDEELMQWDSPDAKHWHQNLQPLVQIILKQWKDFLPKQTYPDRSGMHSNTAFGLVFALDYTMAAKDTAFEKLVKSRAKNYYLNDRNIPATWEPNATDFLSPSLEEADLMRRVLSKTAFIAWLNNFYNLAAWNRLSSPPVISDRTDYMLVHLDGLGLSRAWCLKGIAGLLPTSDKRKKFLSESATKLLVHTLPQIASGNYGGEHWLATFAVYALEQ